MKASQPDTAPAAHGFRHAQNVIAVRMAVQMAGQYMACLVLAKVASVVMPLFLKDVIDS